MIEMLDDVAASPHLPVVAVAVAVLGLVLALLLTAQVARLARRLRGVEARHGADDPEAASGRAGAPTASQPVVSEQPAPAAGDPVGPDGQGADAPGAHEPAAPLAELAAMREAGMLGRQLELLDELERREEDPEALGMLFQLDNLTMRLRRNAESVMVLARGTAGRRAREPLALSDTARTACAQIEGYDRVSVQAGSDPVVQASAVVPLAHLLAELLENATSFSEPDSQVEVRVDEDADGAVVTVADTGIGMDAETLEDARRRLSSSAIPPGGRIGLVVVGRLAQRLGIRVDLEPRAPGTTAVVRVPSRLLVAAHGSGATSPVPAATTLTDADDSPLPPGGTTAPAADPGPLPRRSRARSDTAAPDVSTPAPHPDDPLAWPPAAAGTGQAPASDLPSRPGPAARFGDPAPAWPPLDGGSPASDPLTGGFTPGNGTWSGAGEAPVGGSVAADAPVPSGGMLPGPDPLVDLPATTDAAGGAPQAFLPDGFVPDGFAAAGSTLGTSGPTTERLPRVPASDDGFTPGPAAAPPAPGNADEWFVPARPAAGADAEPALRDEVLAELGRLSSYRPTGSAAGSSTLERRTPVAVAEPVTANRGPVDRDASSVRSRFSAFRSGTGRGRGGRR